MRVSRCWPDLGRISTSPTDSPNMTSKSLQCRPSSENRIKDWKGHACKPDCGGARNRLLDHKGTTVIPNWLKRLAVPGRAEDGVLVALEVPVGCCAWEVLAMNSKADAWRTAALQSLLIQKAHLLSVGMFNCTTILPFSCRSRNLASDSSSV
jgi:hypothetical protein